MSKIRIITDSASDISTENEQKYGIRILPFQLVLGDKSYVSRQDIDNEGFYQLMSECDEIPKTSQITPYEFVNIYLEEAKSGVEEIILVLINSKGSATYGNSCMAIDMFLEEYPEYQGKVKIHSFDGRGYCGLYGTPVVEAAEMLMHGESVSKILQYLDDVLQYRRIYFGMYTLQYAAKSGRIPSAAAFVGEKLNLKPVMKIFDKEITTAAKVRGEGKIISKIADLTISDMEEGSDYDIIYGSDPTCCDEMKQMMEQKLGYGPKNIYQIGAVIAANAGPKVAGVAFNIKKEPTV